MPSTCWIVLNRSAIELVSADRFAVSVRSVYRKSAVLDYATAFAIKYCIVCVCVCCFSVFKHCIDLIASKMWRSAAVFVLMVAAASVLVDASGLV